VLYFVAAGGIRRNTVHFQQERVCNSPLSVFMQFQSETEEDCVDDLDEWTGFMLRYAIERFADLRIYRKPPLYSSELVGSFDTVLMVVMVLHTG
jgi:hypothetical protein